MPYSGYNDTKLPEHIKKLSNQQRKVFVATFNSVQAEAKRDGMSDEEAESKAFAVATAATKRKQKGNKTMSKEMKFDAVIPFFKAEVRDGQMYVSMLASSDTLDKAKERVSPDFITKMKEQATAGEIALLDNHQDTVPIGKSVGVIDGATVWEEAQQRGIQASGPESLFLPEFEIDPEMPTGVKLFKMLESGKADFQCSIGGKAIAKKSFDKELGAVVNELYPGALDHVALTRKGRASNPDCMMFGAVMKSQDWAEIAEPEQEAEKATEDEVRSAVREALRAKYPPDKTTGEYGPWLESFLSFPEAGEVIVERKGGHVKLSYAIVDGKATLGAEVPMKQEWVVAKETEKKPESDPLAEAISKLGEATTALNSTLDAVRGQEQAEKEVAAEEKPAVETPPETIEEKVARLVAEELAKREAAKLEASQSDAASVTKEPPADPPVEESTEKMGAKLSANTKKKMRAVMDAMKQAMGAMETMMGGDETAEHEKMAEKSADEKDALIADLRARVEKLEAQPDGSNMPARTEGEGTEKKFDKNATGKQGLMESAFQLVREAIATGDSNAIATAKELSNKAFTMDMFAK